MIELLKDNEIYETMFIELVVAPNPVKLKKVSSVCIDDTFLIVTSDGERFAYRKSDIVKFHLSVVPF